MTKKVTYERLGLRFLLCFFLLIIQPTDAFQSPLKPHRALRNYSLRYTIDVVHNHEMYTNLFNSYDILKKKHSLELTGSLYGVGDALVQMYHQMRFGKEDGEDGKGGRVD